MTTVLRMCRSLNARRMASTAAWSAAFSSPRPIKRAEAMAAASVSRTASSPMFLSMPSSLQFLQEPVGRASRPPFLADTDVNGMPQREDFVTARPVHLVLEANLHPGVGRDDVDLEQVVVLCRLQILHRRLVDRQHDARLLDVAVGDAERADPFVAGALEEAEIRCVIDDTPLVGVAVDDAI